LNAASLSDAMATPYTLVQSPPITKGEENRANFSALGSYFSRLSLVWQVT